MGWLLLLCSILTEVAGTLCMKFSNGFTNPIPSVLLFVFYGFTLMFLTFTLRYIDLSIVYSIWAGLGTAIISVIGMVYFKEDVSVIKILLLTMIALAAMGLKLFQPT